MMRNVRICGWSLLLAFTLCVMTACGGSDGGAGETTAAQTTAGGNTGTTRSHENEARESTGVLDGVLDDVEKGVDDAVDGMTGKDR